MSDIVAFGEILQHFRKRKKTSQRALAQKLGVHYNTIWAWERGDYLPDTKGVVLELARLLQLDEDETRQLLEASLTGLSPYWLIPFQRNVFYTGRESILERIHETLGKEKQAVINHSLAIRGLGGVGKTQTALEYCYSHHHVYSAVFWVHAETTATLFASFLAIGNVLHVSEAQENDQQKVVQAVQRWLDTHKEWLLVFDNVEDVACITPFLPKSRQGAILYTTRRQSLGSISQVVSLEVFTIQEGINFLLRRSQLHLSDELLTQDIYETAKAIVEAVGGLPLALDQAAAYIEESGCSLQDYLSLFRERQKELLHFRTSEQEEKKSLDHPHSVLTTFSLAFEKVEQSHPVAADILRLCAFLFAENIPEDLLTRGAHALSHEPLKAALNDLLAFNDAMTSIRTVSLLHREPNTKLLSMHRLVQIILRENMTAKEQHDWANEVINLVNHAYPEVRELQEWSLCQRYLPQAQTCIATIASFQINTPEARRLTIQVADYLGEQSQHHEAIQILKAELFRQRNVTGEHHPDLARIYNVLGNNYYMLSSYEEAQNFYQEALSLSQQACVSHPFEYAASISNLGMLALSRRNYTDAKALLEQALTIYDAHNEKSIDMARTLDSMGGLYFEQEHYPQAFHYFLASYQLRCELLPADHLYISMNLGQLAIVEMRLEQDHKAEQHLVEALRLIEKPGAPSHKLAATHHTWLGLLYQKQGSLALAEEHLQQAINISTKMITGVRSQIQYHFNLAQLYISMERFEDAEVLLDHCKQLHEQHLPDDTRIAVKMYQSFVQLLQMTQRSQEADTYQQRIHALEQTEKSSV